MLLNAAEVFHNGAFCELAITCARGLIPIGVMAFR
jgi:hypothetical protein